MGGVGGGCRVCLWGRVCAVWVCFFLAFLFTVFCCYCNSYIISIHWKVCHFGIALCVCVFGGGGVWFVCCVCVCVLCVCVCVCCIIVCVYLHVSMPVCLCACDGCVCFSSSWLLFLQLIHFIIQWVFSFYAGASIDHKES